MEDKIKSIMKEYIEKVNHVCHNLLESLNLKTKWDFYEYRSIQRKMEFEANGIKYVLHGRGCWAFNEKFYLDWDFGYGSRWCGIDPWLLARTLERNKSNHIEYYDGNLIKKECEQAVLEGEMYQKYDMYYFTIPISETFEPDFPKEFDTLIVEHFDSQWRIPRNKLVDRFIRKSKRVYQQIGNNHDTYILKFTLDGKEKFSIPFDDIGYPEKAVRIMFHEILNNIGKEYK